VLVAASIAVMFLRRNRRTVAGETDEYWPLCKTVRTARGPRQQVVATLGKEPGLERRTRHGWEEITELLEGPEPAPLQGRLSRAAAAGSPAMGAGLDRRGVRVERVRDFWAGVSGALALAPAGAAHVVA